MKIFFTVTAGALLFGVSALLHAPVAHALPLCSPTCDSWWAACGQGNQYDCMLFHNLCSGCAPSTAVRRAPPTQGNNKFGVALLNTKRTVLSQ